MAETTTAGTNKQVVFKGRKTKELARRGLISPKQADKMNRGREYAAGDKADKDDGKGNLAGSS